MNTANAAKVRIRSGPKLCAAEGRLVVLRSYFGIVLLVFVFLFFYFFLGVVVVVVVVVFVVWRVWRWCLWLAGN